MFSFSEEGVRISVHSHKRKFKEELTHEESLKFEKGRWYEFLIQANHEDVLLKIRSTATNETVTLSEKHSELDRHNSKFEVLGIHNLQTISLAAMDVFYYENF